MVYHAPKSRSGHVGRYKKKESSRKVLPFYKSIPRTTTSQDGAMPKLFKTSLKYREAIRFTTNGLVPDVYVFRANDLFDPNFTSTGHQPRGFDQMMQWYSHFTVLASKIEVYPVCTAGLVTFGVQLSDSSTSVGTSQDWPEQPRMVTSTRNVYEGNAKAMKYYFDANKFFGITAPIQASQLQGSTAGGPSEQAYYHIFSQPIDTTATVICEYSVLITYQVVFHGPRLQASS